MSMSMRKIRWESVFLMALFTLTVYFIVKMFNLFADLEYADVVKVLVSAIIGGTLAESFDTEVKPKSITMKAEY